VLNIKNKQLHHFYTSDTHINPRLDSQTPINPIRPPYCQSGETLPAYTVWICP